MFSGRQILKNTLLLTAAALLLRFASMLFQAHLAGRIGCGRTGRGAAAAVRVRVCHDAGVGRDARSGLVSVRAGARQAGAAQVQLAAAHCLGFVLVTSTLAAAGLYWAAPVLAGACCTSLRR